MAARKRVSSRSRRSGLVGRAVRAGRKALHEAESRVPPDLRRQLERTIKDGQKTLKIAIDQLQVQVRRTAKQADVDKALKRLEGLRKQVQRLARDASSRGAARASSTTRRAATAKRRASGTAKRAKSPVKRAKSPAKTTARSTPRRSTPSSSGATVRRTAPRRSSPRRVTALKPEIRYIPPAPEPGPMPDPVDSGS
jgi:polyhydroxyalkanoate synthesis regulator phasin